jgi:catechol-2,3-dioxygenase
MNIWHSLNGKAHVHDDIGLDVFMIRMPDRSFIETLVQEFEDRVQKMNRNELWVSDPDGIQILIKSN